ncbi:unnamed protein product (macronuclear) [Paramecium tetraurelia]|uniref:Uncharacterized protein n=1 Tax=Paramecium tetraurelia TaxID=5888 RepID=A0CX52_PARTE|nr:uncharacterized protein GSPATT00001573001 [Paramecium tetraurelia]CAK75369.1 unnamed protein product [Paramecium tetraurelia]|eukprot:XP_001442766.1 hypothetical protein (macronuclear) [Paramecium tetraurelia strain d4-2]
MLHLLNLNQILLQALQNILLSLNVYLKYIIFINCNQDLTQSITDFKAKYYESLHNLMSFFGQLSNGHDIILATQYLETHLKKYKQQQIFIQMKNILNLKLKALLETFPRDNNQKLEVLNQITSLKDSLMKIESTLFEQKQLLSPSQQYFITPHPKKGFIQTSSKNTLTPNLSDEAEMRGKGVFITPENRQQQPSQFDHSHQQYSSTESYSKIQNKTLNSFDKEQSENKQDLLSPMFGFQEQPCQSTQFFQDDIINKLLYQNYLDQNVADIQIDNHQQGQTPNILQQFQQTFQEIDSLQTTRTEQQDNPLESESLQKIRNQSVEPNIRENSISPNGKRLIQTSNSKESFSRCKSTLDTTNLLQRLNQVEVPKKINIMSKSNKENQSQINSKQLKQSKPVSFQKQKGLVTTKAQSQQNLIKKSKSN